MLYLNIKQIEMGCVIVSHSCHPNTTYLFSVSSKSGQVIPPHQQIGLGLKNHDIIIK